MTKDLEEALVNIEAKLGGAEKPHMDLGGHLDYIEDLLGKSSGTKLYKHILYDSSMDYKFILITTNSEPIKFSVLNTSEKLYNYLLTQNVIRFTTDTEDSLQYDPYYEHSFYKYYIEKTGTTTELKITAFSDWSLEETTDTVTELYYDLNTYSYYIYVPNELIATNSVALIKLIRYQSGTTLAQAKDYVNNAKNNGLNLYMPESDLVTKRKFNSYQEAKDFIDTMQSGNGIDTPAAVKSAWVIETVAES